MNLDIAATLLVLGDATSRNLEFSHRDDVRVSYGEETITEGNILEIRRRHQDIVRVHTFPKHVEARTGADWEWHIIGQRRTLKMRVQAKRVQCNDVLKISHKVRSSGEQQRDLLIAGAHAAGMKAVYCIYCTEPQRKFWKEFHAPPGYRSFQTGCLLADATHLLPTTKKLEEIEERCKPWHHLFAPVGLIQEESEFFPVYWGGFEKFFRISLLQVPLVEAGQAPEAAGAAGWNAPTVDDLNADTDREFDPTGVEATTERDLARLQQDLDDGSEVAQSDGVRLRDLGIYRMIVIDVRGGSIPEERDERRRR
ncbi:MAG: hypothetical protein OXG96_06395 [Acidobacteria bacterium]|nr:hypothetical protein [Acidobacteriota bacterium]